MTKVISLTVLHYGAQYLGAALTSVINHVDQAWVLYTDKGSHGARTDIPCPETEDELHAIAQAAAGSKLRWHKGEYTYEGQHREKIHELCPDADVIVVVDADEIWGEGLLWYYLESIGRNQLSARQWRVPIIHYWRSFYKCVLHDPAFPQRIIFPKITSGEGQIDPFYGDGMPSVINHMGYAQTPPVVYYKQYTHGHIGEWRWKEDWYHTKFLANAQTDVHPVGSEYWNPETVNPLDYMPQWMQYHKFFGMEVIE